LSLKEELLALADELIPLEDETDEDLYEEVAPLAAWQFHVAEINRRSLQWRDNARCKGSTGLMFATTSEDQADAASRCYGCPVQVDCLYMGLMGLERFGVWGGTTQRQRRRMLRQINTDLGKNWRENLGSEQADHIMDVVRDFVGESVTETAQPVAGSKTAFASSV
jgi:WhiB family redox-sensing transcriptional regulator